LKQSGDARELGSTAVAGSAGGTTSHAANAGAPLKPSAAHADASSGGSSDDDDDDDAGPLPPPPATSSPIDDDDDDDDDAHQRSLAAPVEPARVVARQTSALLINNAPVDSDDDDSDQPHIAKADTDHNNTLPSPPVNNAASTSGAVPSANRNLADSKTDDTSISYSASDSESDDEAATSGAARATHKTSGTVAPPAGAPAKRFVPPPPSGPRPPPPPSTAADNGAERRSSNSSSSISSSSSKKSEVVRSGSARRHDRHSRRGEKKEKEARGSGTRKPTRSSSRTASPATRQRAASSEAAAAGSDRTRAPRAADVVQQGHLVKASGSGGVRQRAKARYFVLLADRLLYYTEPPAWADPLDAPLRRDAGAEPEVAREMDLLFATVVDDKTKSASDCAVTHADGSTTSAPIYWYVSCDARLVQRLSHYLTLPRARRYECSLCRMTLATPGRVYELGARSAGELTRWRYCFQSTISMLSSTFQANQAASGATPPPAGKRRVAATVRATTLKVAARAPVAFVRQPHSAQ
jgi:hypothetical protein